jgi:hypothetical protein
MVVDHKNAWTALDLAYAGIGEVVAGLTPTGLLTRTRCRGWLVVTEYVAAHGSRLARWRLAAGGSGGLHRGLAWQEAGKRGKLRPYPTRREPRP